MTRTTLHSTRQPPMAFDVASCTTHAHPTHHPNATPPFEDGRRTLEDLLPNAQVELRLCGPSISAATKPLDLYCPQVRRSPFKDSENVVNHLDVVSCWKGLLHSQAIEIALWEKIFQNCLKEQARGSLLGTLVLHLFHSNGPMDEHSIMCRMIEYITIHDELLIGIDVTRLLEAMIEELSVRQCELPCGSFASSRNLPAIICTFFRTRDCFLNTSKGPCLALRMSHRLSNAKLEIFGEVQWQRPNISFSSLPTNIAPGMEYCISPRHRELQIQYKGQSSHLSTLPPTVVYTVTADVTPLDWMWDPANTCFRTCVSNDSAQTQTAFSAKIVRPFSGNVRFEQTTRYNLNVPVSQVQPHLPCVISRVNYPAQEDWSPAMSASELLVGTRKVDGAPALSSPESSKTRVGDPRGGDRDTKALYSPRMAQVEYRGLQKHKAVNRMPSDATFQSPDAFQNARLALDKFEHLDLEIIKRQKLDRRIDSGVWLLQDVPIRDDEDDDDLPAGLGSVSTGPLGDAFSSPKICSDTWSKRLEADVGHDISFVSKSRAYDTALSKVMPALKKRGSVKRMLFRWPKYLDEPVSLATRFFNGVDQNIASHTTLPGTPASPPSETDGSTLLDLTQSQIQDNYNLFKKQAEVRRTGDKIHEVVSLGRKVSDSEYKEFERIFLGEESQGEDWNTDIDCVDEDTD